MKAVQRRPDVDVILSGVGWPDWDNNIPAVENLKRVMPDCDVVWWYKPEGNPRKNVPETNRFRNLADTMLIVEKWQECWHGEAGPNDPQPVWTQCVDRRVHLAILSHANDVPRMAEAAKRGVTVAVIPHGAEPEVFAHAAQGWPGRKIDVLLTGSIGPNHYPLRTRWKALMDADRLPGKCCLHAHPGYWFNGEAQAEAKVRDYAANLGKSKIILGCSSRWRYPLARFAEAAMAGAVHVSDIPERPPEGYEDFIVPVEADWPDERLIRTVADLLADEARLRAMGERAQATARRSFTWDIWAERFVDAVKQTLEARR